MILKACELILSFEILPLIFCRFGYDLLLEFIDFEPVDLLKESEDEIVDELELDIA